MTDQTIQEEIARELYESDGRYSWTWDELVEGWDRGQENGLDPNYPHLVKAFREKADLILTSPVIRRIRAEAAAKTLRDLSDKYAGFTSEDPLQRLQYASTSAFMAAEAEAIEQNSEGNVT